MVIKRGSNNKVFMIYPNKEKDILAKFKKRAIFGLIVGGAFLSAAILLLIYSLYFAR